MNLTILQILLSVLLLVTAVPIGLLLAWLCKDELVDGRKWFRLIIYVSAILFLICLFVYNSIIVLGSFVYLMILSAVALKKSYNKKFVKN